MTMFSQISGCAGCGVSRRRFLAQGCAACVGAAGLAASQTSAAEASSNEKVRVRIVYALHSAKQARPDWPNIGFDFAPVMTRFQRELAERCPEIEFVVSTATGAEQAAAILKADADAKIDGYLVFQMNCWNPVVQTFVKSGKPTLYADFQFGGSGGFLLYTSQLLTQGVGNFAFMPSSDLAHTAEAVRCIATLKKSGGSADAFGKSVAQVRVARTLPFAAGECQADSLKTISAEECVRRMKQSRILVVGGHAAGDSPSVLGVAVRRVAFQELNEAWKAADREATKAVADRWAKSAASVKEVSRPTLEASAAMYLAQKALLTRYHAQAITIDCLGGFYGGHIHAYPCLGFYELLNEGLIGACEADLTSTLTMVAVSHLTEGRPGYISDPVIDIASRRIIYAHCVASSRPFGPQGASNPFHILTHSEDRNGAAVRSILPVGMMTSTVEIYAHRREIYFHRAKAVANSDDDRACRTKLAAEPVGDMEKMFRMWNHGWHRVTYYGDLYKPTAALADAIGFKLIDECA